MLANHRSCCARKLATILALLLLSTSGVAIEIGELAPAFEMRRLDGEPLRLADYRGKKAVYLVFWNTWCTYCVDRVPHYQRLHQNLGDRLEIIAVNTTWSDSKESIAQFQQRFGLDYPIVIDEGNAMTKRYGVKGVPTEFIIGIDGVVRHRDGVPEFLAAHIPDWFAPYRPGSAPAQMCAR